MSNTTNRACGTGMEHLFNYLGNKVRVAVIDGAPWFVVNDICGNLNLQNPAQAVKNINKNDKGLYPIYTRGGRQRMLCVSESGLYALVMRSDKPEARKFQDWVYSTVLPAIRKDGMYVAGEEKLATGEMSAEEMELLVFTRLREKVERVTAERDAAIARAEHERAVRRVAEEERDGAIEHAEYQGRIIGQHRHSIFQFVRTIRGVNAAAVKQDLKRLGFLYTTKARYRVYSKFAALFEEGFAPAGNIEIFATAEGKDALLRLARSGKLTMKAGFRGR